MQSRTAGICATPGKGTLPDYPGVYIHSMYDEHAIIYSREFRDGTRIGDKVRIIPVHICPVCNLYDRAWLVDGDEVTAELDIACRGRLHKNRSSPPEQGASDISWAASAAFFFAVGQRRTSPLA